MPGGKNNIRPSDNPKPFVKGDPRCNREGAPKKIPSLDKVLADLLGDNDEMQAVINKIIAEAKKGNMRASELLMDRVYGKTSQTVKLEGKINIEPKTWIDGDV